MIAPQPAIFPAFATRLDSPKVQFAYAKRLVVVLALTLLTHTARSQGPVRMYNDALEDYMASRYVQAEEKLKLVIKQQKIYPDAYFLMGQCHWQEKAFNKAIKWYNKALKQTPTNVEFLFHKGLAYEDLHNVTKAVRYYLQSTKIDPHYSLAWKHLGGIFFASGSFEKAIDYYTSAVESNPIDKEAFMLRGNAQSALGNLPEAVTDYNMVLQLDADDADAWFNLANSEARLNNVYEAMKAYSMVIDYRPNDRDALLNRGIVLLALGLHQDALKDFDGAIAADSSFAASWWNKGYLLYETGEYDQALTCALQASGIAPKDPENWSLIGRIEFKQRLYKQAIAAYDRCISLNGASAEAFLNRGEAKRVLGDQKGACKDWHQVLRLDDGPIAEKAELWIEINCK